MQFESQNDVILYVVYASWILELICYIFVLHIAAKC